MANFPGTVGDDVYPGTAENDFIQDGGGGNDSLAGAGGDDTIEITGGQDTVDGGGQGIFGDRLVLQWGLMTGNITMSAGLITDGLGNSVSYSNIETFRAIGGSGNDTLIGASGQDELRGGAGDDRLESGGSGLSGADTLVGGLGADTLVCGPAGSFGGQDLILLTSTADSLDATADSVIGFTTGVDILDLQALALTASTSLVLHQTPTRSVVLIDLAGDGIYESRIVFDTVLNAVDLRYFAAAAPGVIMIGDGSAQTLVGALRADVINSGGGNDTVRASNGADTIFGGDGNDDLSGEAGDDVIYGGAGSNVLRGGDGDDTLYAESGGDLYGGTGNDVIYGSSTGNYIEGGTGADVIYGFAGNDTISSNGDGAVVIAGDGNDLLFSQASNTIFGEGGADSLEAFAGNQTVFGGAANDTLAGGDGADYLHGEDGADRITGDIGADVLFGGAGADTFLYIRDLGGAFPQTESTAAAADFIGDFEKGVDSINLSGVDANTVAAGDQAFAWDTDGGALGIGQARLTYDAATNRTLFEGEMNGDGVPDLVILIHGDVGQGDGFVL